MVETYARFETSLTGERQSGFGAGPLGFVELQVQAGPGHLFAALSWSSAQVVASTFQLESGGPAVTALAKRGVRRFAARP